MGLFGLGKSEQPPATSSSSSGRSTPNVSTKGKEKEVETPVAKSSWLSARSMLAVSAVSALAAAAGTAYYKRGDIASGWQWVGDHAVWLKNLWDSEGMKRRLEGVVELGGEVEEALDMRMDGMKGKRRGDRVLFRKWVYIQALSYVLKHIAH